MRCSGFRPPWPAGTWSSGSSATAAWPRSTWPRTLRHHRAVAIKVLSDEISAAIGAERFLREIEIAASLTHPNILPLLDSGDRRPGQPAVLRDAVHRGRDARERMSREGQLPVDEAVRLGREVADALQHAHDRGVIHRDIKPENILLAGGHAMVADFGVARALAQPGVKAITKTGMAVGTPQYMSPEQAAADPSVDGRSDLYALGTLLYEMLAGSVPYPGPTAHAILARKMSGPPPSLRGAAHRVRALERAVFKSMEIAPADRFNRHRRWAWRSRAPSRRLPFRQPGWSPRRLREGRGEAWSWRCRDRSAGDRGPDLLRPKAAPAWWTLKPSSCCHSGSMARTPRWPATGSACSTCCTPRSMAKAVPRP